MKKGITLTLLMVSVAIMIVILSSAAVIGIGYVNEAKYNHFNDNLYNIMSKVNEYYITNDRLPITNEAYTVESDNIGFKTALLNNLDQTSPLYVLDNRAIGISDNRKYLIAFDTHNVYDLEGMEYDNRMNYYYIP